MLCSLAHRAAIALVLLLRQSWQSHARADELLICQIILVLHVLTQYGEYRYRLIGGCWCLPILCVILHSPTHHAHYVVHTLVLVVLLKDTPLVPAPCTQPSACVPLHRTIRAAQQGDAKVQLSCTFRCALCCSRINPHPTEAPSSH